MNIAPSEVLVAVDSELIPTGLERSLPLWSRGRDRVINDVAITRERERTVDEDPQVIIVIEGEGELIILVAVPVER